VFERLLRPHVAVLRGHLVELVDGEVAAFDEFPETCEFQFLRRLQQR
jgi:hypothetical protein